MSRRIRQTVVILSIVFIVLIFFLGVFQMIPWQYVVGMITGIGVIAAIIRYYPPKIDSEKKEVEAPPARETETQNKFLLTDDDDLTSIRINNDFLNQLYNQAHGQAITKYHDAELRTFNLDVWPFGKVSAKVTIFFRFVSKSAQRICTFIYDDKDQKINYNPPDGFVEKDFEKKVFSTLPWNESPHWLEFLKRMYAKISPLSPVMGTHYYLHVFPSQDDSTIWMLTFSDGFSGKDYSFKWNGKEIDNARAV